MFEQILRWLLEKIEGSKHNSIHPINVIVNNNHNVTTSTTVSDGAATTQQAIIQPSDKQAPARSLLAGGERSQRAVQRTEHRGLGNIPTSGVSTSPQSHEATESTDEAICAFERSVRERDDIDRLLGHSDRKGAANAAFDTFMRGKHCSIDSWRKSATWQQVRAACLNSIIDQLSRKGRRASYGAVAGLLRVAPNGLMEDRDNCWPDSWIVAATSDNRSMSRKGWPTGYTNGEIDPRCLGQSLSGIDDFIKEEAALRIWLKNIEIDEPI